MTISTTDRKAGPFDGNDVTVAFPFTFKVFSSADLYVIKADSAGAETVLVLSSDFTVSLNADQDSNPGGTLTLPAALATGYTLTITSDIDALQPVELTNMGGFYPTVINTALDRITMILQQLAESVARSFRFTVSTDSTLNAEISPDGGKLIGFDVDGNLTTFAAETGTSLVDLSASSGSSLVGFIQDETGAVAVSVQAKLRERVSVLDFGADPTGATDSTVAFNLATRSDYASVSNYDLNFPSEVIVPAGQYRITGTVYVHKGQHLKGMGEGATRILLDTAPNTAHIFKLGYSTAGADAGGLPPEISGMWMYGGPSSYGNVFCDQGGFSIHDLFMSAPGIGIQATGTDGRINNIQIDEGLTGLKIGGHDHNVSNVLIYLTHFGIITDNGTGTTCSDITFDTIQMAYVEYLGVQFTTGVTHNNLKFNNCNFHLNAQHATFLGFVLTQCNYANGITFDSCVFANMKGAAYYHSSGLDNEITFNNCVFEGNKTVAGYAQSTTAYAVKSENEDVFLYNCQFRNLLAEPILANGAAGTTRITVEGGTVVHCAGTTMFAIGATAPTAYAGFLSCNNVFFQDEPTSAFPATSGWNLATTHGHVLPGNGATAVAMRPSGRNSTYFVNTTAAAAKITLPRNDINGYHTPKHGDRLTFIDYAQTWNAANVTFDRGTGTINGAGADYVGNVNGATLVFTYNAVTNDWNVKA